MLKTGLTSWTRNVPTRLDSHAEVIKMASKYVFTLAERFENGPIEFLVDNRVVQETGDTPPPSPGGFAMPLSAGMHSRHRGSMQC